MVAEGDWRRRGGLLELAPQRFGSASGESPRGERSRAPAGVLEFIGGSYLATTPHISYRRLLEALSARGWLLRAWSYVPGFDHQSQANEAWRAFRRAREESPLEGAPVVRLGHSLGCKLHLLAPDNGRASNGLVALSFNNFSAERSVPLLGELGQQFGFRSEFSPSPTETLRLVGRSYRQPRNLLVRFRGDGLDQSRRLHAVLQERPDDATTLLDLPGDHLTPASAGLRRQLLGDWADDPSRQRQIDRLADTICAWMQPADT